MFCGRYESVIDAKWQLSLSVGFAEGFGNYSDSIIVVSVDNGCVSIYPYPEGKDFLPHSLEVNLRRGEKKKYARITIPELFRETTSFHYGKTITVVGVGDHIELWPRPPWTKAVIPGRPARARAA